MRDIRVSMDRNTELWSMNWETVLYGDLLYPQKN